VEIEELSSAGEGDVSDLVALLRDGVESGASSGFLAPLDEALAAGYWRERIAESASGRRALLVARERGRIVGSVQLLFAAQQNGRHRAEVQRLVVLRSARGRGIGTALMDRLEALARSRGVALVTLNTRAGDPPEALYLRLGYTIVGPIPDFAQNPDGSLNTTSIMYKLLGDERA
jgi:ribosomal protein S18 acetylase RimI-like enzyme